jgi:cytochrome c-type biogenesis protein CcmH
VQKFFLPFVIILIISQFFLSTSHSVEPDEMLQNSKLELRARNISKNVRCLVCQNQSIDESSAPLAKDLRILIRNKVKNGDTDDEIYNFLIDRYGDFVLLKPLFKFNTFILWIMPFVFLAIGIFIIYWHHKKSNKTLL